MPVYPLPSVTDMPTSTLVAWSVFETETAQRHLCGYSRREREGRVTSAVLAFDPATGSFTTSRGRVYRVEGQPGHDLDAEYVRGRWLAINGSPAIADVTQEVWNAIQDARAGEASQGDFGPADDAASSS